MQDRRQARTAINGDRRVRPEALPMADEPIQNTTHVHMKWREMETQTTTPPPPPARRVPAGILAILLGALGAHKFFLGYPVPGTLMLLASGLCFAFGAPALIGVVALVGLIEGILYLRKSDADFISDYQTHRRSWF
jgi:TM2 domain-containing membrane protein YozV